VADRRLSESERQAWLRLARAPNVGPVTFAQLVARFGSASAALEEVPRLVRRGGGNAASLPSEADARREIDALAKLGGRLIASVEPDYPRGLAALEAPPPVIAMLGHEAILGREMIAVVGARNASALGRKLAHRLAEELGAAGLVVVSGMARGIDTAAHEGALKSGTCAVVAGGSTSSIRRKTRRSTNASRPKRHRLGNAGGPAAAGAPFSAPQPDHLRVGARVIVVEAAEGSGSLITANFALEQNREVFAVPGSPLDPRAKGANRLLRQGAVLTETADDVLGVLKPILGGGFQEPMRDFGGTPPAGEPAEAEADRSAPRSRKRSDPRRSPLTS